MKERNRQQEGTSSWKSWGIVALALADDVIIIAVVFLLLWAFDIVLSVWAYVVVGLLLAVFIFIVHRAIITSLRKRKTTGREGMVGQTGVVMETLQPAGTVQIGGEYWNASSGGDTIEKGDEVEITGVKGLRLEVRKKV